MVTRRRRAGLVAARKAAGYTQEDLAEALHVDRSTVIRWEAGMYAPVPYLWPKLGRLLDLSRDQLVAVFAPDAQSQLAEQTVTLEDMRRRTLMRWGVAATAAASLNVGMGGTTVGLEDVRRLRRAAGRLHDLDQRHGGDTLWQAALVQIHGGKDLLEHGRYTDAVARELLMATGELQMCAGWLALDAGQHDVARDCLGEALAMSRQANDPRIETRALANLAFQANLLGKPREARRYAFGAEQAATGDGAPRWLTALPQLRIATSSARLGDGTDADRAVTKARRALDRDNDTAGEEWSSFLCSSEIDGIEASCALKLGRAARAERLLESVILSYEKRFTRNLASWRVLLARARLATGSVEGAAEAANEALDDLSGEVASWRVATKLEAVATRLASFPEVAEVGAFLDRHQAMARA